MKINLINPSQTSFKGIKNVGYLNYEFEYANQTKKYQSPDDDDDGDNFIRGNDRKKETSELINIQFTDDYSGKHLTEYKKIMNKYPQYKNEFNNNFLNFLQISNDNQNLLVVNSKPLDLNDQNLSLVSFIAKTLKEISQKKPQEFIVNKDYLLSDDFSKGFIPHMDLNEVTSEDFTASLAEDFHEPETVKTGSQNMISRLTEIMMKYFE